MCLSLSAPKPFHPSGAPPPPSPGLTRPPAPLCERGLLPDLASSSPLSPTQKNSVEVTPKTVFQDVVWFCLFTVTLLCAATLAVAAESGQEGNEDRTGERKNKKESKTEGKKQRIKKTPNALLALKHFKNEPKLQNTLWLWKSTQGHLKQSDKWAKLAPPWGPKCHSLH